MENVGEKLHRSARKVQTINAIVAAQNSVHFVNISQFSYNDIVNLLSATAWNNNNNNKSSKASLGFVARTKKKSKYWKTEKCIIKSQSCTSIKMHFPSLWA